MTSFEQFTSTLDRDGDSMTVTKVHPDHYTVKVQGADGDFRTAYVSTDDMLSIARAILAAEEGDCYRSCPQFEIAARD